jgi:glycine cleavage system aminomethyltransferase T
LQEDLGAVVDENGFVLRYGEEIEEEVKILRNECAIIDRSQWGVFRVASGGGGDMRRFLEIMASSSSNDGAKDSSTESFTMEELEKIQPGTGKRVNGRLDIYAQESGAFLVIVSREDVKEKKVETVAKECGISEVTNLASRCVLLTVCGPKTLEVLKPTGLAMVLEAGKEYENAHAVFGFANRPVVCCKTNEFLGKCGEESAVNFVVDEGVAGQVWAAIIKAGAIPVGSEALDAVLG